MAETTKTETTATELLRQQHQTVQQLLSQFVPSSGSDRGDLFDCLQATLAVHETAEEMVVYPVLRGINDQGRQIAEKRINEESEAKDVLAQLEKLGVDDPGFEPHFEQFRTSVLEHAEAEEAEVFPMLEAHVEGEKLQKMATSIRLAEKMAPTHPHPHGPDSA